MNSDLPLSPTPLIATECAAPTGSRIAQQIVGSYFHDAWQVRAGDPALSALGQFLKAAQQTPKWVSACISLRNRVVGLFGLKNLGALEAVSARRKDSDYQLGDRVGIFTLFENSFDEVLLGDKTSIST